LLKKILPKKILSKKVLPGQVLAKKIPVTVKYATVVLLMILLLFYILRLPVQADLGSITANLSSNKIAVGNKTVLTINITGSQSAEPYIEGVSGLNFISAGQSMQYRNINGKASSSVSYRFLIYGATAGNYVIPPIRANINGKILKTEPLNLYVAGTGNSAAQSRSGSAQSQASSLSSKRAGNANQQRNNEVEQTTFLRVYTTRKNFYIGEQVPVVIKAYFKEGVQASINSLPSFNSTAFAFHGMDAEPLQETKIINGQRYIVLTWKSAMSGVKEGEYPVSAVLSATVVVRDTRSRRNSPFGRSMFDDAFFNNFFGQVREEKIEIQSPEQKIAVLPLPGLGRPANFTGAVGRFKLSAKATPTHLMAGDPITLTMTVKGSGNFDRVSAPKLNNIKGWKTYSPDSEFKTKDGSGYTGRKVFEQAIIPQSNTMDEIPSVAFSYFDTKKKKYITLKTKAIPITVKASSSFVTGNNKISSNNTSGQNGTNDNGLVTKPIQQNIDPDTGLAPVCLELGKNADGLASYFNQPWFVVANAISPILLFCGFFLVFRQRKKIENPQIVERRKTKQKIGIASKQMEKAIYECNSMIFFNAARQAIQERLTDVWQIPPEAITLGDIKEKLPENEHVIRKIFELADAVTYSGLTLSQDELRGYKKSLLKELSKNDIFFKLHSI